MPHLSPAISRGRVIGALLVVGPVIVLVFLPTVLGLQRFVVTDDAMVGPGDGSIDRGSIALTRSVPAEDLEVGDVIAFRPPVDDGVEPGASVTRRIVAIEDGVAVTRGDGRDAPDPWRIDVTQDTYPQVVLSVPWIGYPFVADAGQGGWMVLVMASIAALLLAAIGQWRQHRQRLQEAHREVHAYP